MCQECVIEVSPDRGNVTVESGFYPLNMKKCKIVKHSQLLKLLIMSMTKLKIHPLLL